MKRSRKQNEEIRRMIRDIVARRPMITSRQLADEVSARLRFPVGRNYVMSLLKKVDGELAYEAKQNPDVKDRVRQSMEMLRVAKEKLMAIAYWTPDYARRDPSLLFMPSHKEQINALRALGILEKLSFEMELDAGIYKRHLGTLDHRSLPLADDTKRQIWAAIEAWGIPVPMLHADVQVIEHGESTNAAQLPAGATESSERHTG